MNDIYNNSLNYAQELLNRITHIDRNTPIGMEIYSPLVLVFLSLSSSHIEIPVILLLFLTVLYIKYLRLEKYSETLFIKHLGQISRSMYFQSSCILTLRTSGES